MSQPKKILITDYAWATLEPEREVLSAIGAELIVAETGTEMEFLKYAPDVDGILTNWAKVTTDVVKAAEKCQVIGRYGIGLDNRCATLRHSYGIGRIRRGYGMARTTIKAGTGERKSARVLK